jgi:uncharacterized protein YfaA (DUF2138 family)
MNTQLAELQAVSAAAARADAVARQAAQDEVVLSHRAGQGAMVGAIGGALLGAIAVAWAASATVVVLPVVGGLMAGALGAALVGALAGLVNGGLAGAVIGWGIPREVRADRVFPAAFMAA